MWFGPVPRRWAHRRRLRAVFDPHCEVLTMDVNLARRSAWSLSRSAGTREKTRPVGYVRLISTAKEPKKTKRQPSRGGGQGE
ncbi:unnamed protein product [Ectocarpus sp. 8 AP-2014]